MTTRRKWLKVLKAGEQLWLQDFKRAKPNRADRRELAMVRYEIAQLHRMLGA
jgi:hypothetical protein